MSIRCSQCRELVPEEAVYCINCGRLVRQAPPQTHRLNPAASGTTMHLQPASLFAESSPAIGGHAQPGGIDALVALGALAFAVAEIFGIATLIAQHHWSGLGLWPAVLLAAGGLLAENDWMNGALRRGMYGMACWGALPWLLATQQDLAWLLLPALGWWLLWFCDRRPQDRQGSSHDRTRYRNKPRRACAAAPRALGKSILCAKGSRRDWRNRGARQRWTHRAVEFGQ